MPGSHFERIEIGNGTARDRLSGRR